MCKYLILCAAIFFSVIIHGQTLSVPEKREILKVLEDQRIAWNSGDIRAYMNGYWNSDSLRFIGKDGVTYGWQDTFKKYLKSYPTKEDMGILTFEVISLEKLSDESAFMIGKWNLQKKGNSVGGHFTLIWRKIGGKWVVTTDHTS